MCPTPYLLRCDLILPQLAGLGLPDSGDPPASASQVLRLQACTSTLAPNLVSVLKRDGDAANTEGFGSHPAGYVKPLGCEARDGGGARAFRLENVASTLQETGAAVCC